MVIIEMNPRVSRSSAFSVEGNWLSNSQSSRKTSCGIYTLDELTNEITKATPGIIRADN